MKKILLFTLVVFISINLCTIDLSAQADFMRQKSGTWIACEVNFPNISENNKYYSGWNTVLHLKTSVSEKLYLLFELPIGHGKVEYTFYSDRSETAIGNPYIGVQYITNTKGLTFDAGVRAPIADENKGPAYFPSHFSDLDRFAMFIPNAVDINILGDYEFDIEAGVYGNVSVGPSILIPTKDEYNDTELYANYTLGMGYKNELLNLSAGINGFMFISEDDLSFDERTLHHFTVKGSVSIGKIEPGLIFRIPMDEYSFHDLIFGLNLGVRLGG